mgnify:CR=1 FL=1
MASNSCISIAASDVERTFNSASMGISFRDANTGRFLFDPNGQILGPVRAWDLRGSLTQKIYDFGAFARLRLDGIVTTRREQQTIHYSLASEKVSRLIGLLDEAGYLVGDLEELARQLAMTTYRSAADFDGRFGRGTVPDGRFAVASYLDYQGEKLEEMDRSEEGVRVASFDLGFVLLSSPSSQLWVCPGAKPASQLAPYVKFHVRIAHDELLGIGVDCNELNAAKACIDHSVKCVNTTATNANNLDNR